MDNNIDIIAQISSLKEIDYKNTLAISTLIKLLIEKDVFSKKEFSNMANLLDKLADTQIETLQKAN